jgi:hypothetical protein
MARAVEKAPPVACRDRLRGDLLASGGDIDDLARGAMHFREVLCCGEVELRICDLRVQDRGAFARLPLSLIIA